MNANPPSHKARRFNRYQHPLQHVDGCRRGCRTDFTWPGRNRLFSLVTSNDQLEEFRRVTRYPRVKERIDPARPPVRFIASCITWRWWVVLHNRPILATRKTSSPLKKFGTTRIVTRQMLGKLGRI